MHRLIIILESFETEFANYD